MPRWLSTIGKLLWGILGVLLLAAVVVVLVYTRTDWGRRHVLAFGLKQLESRVHGYVRIGDLHGNLLTGARLDDVVITDSARRPFFAADTVQLRYSLRSLLAKHLVLRGVRLVHATVVLDKPPREDWNFARIFPSTRAAPTGAPGFGSWVLIENMTMRGSTFMVRDIWAPPDSLRGRARDAAVAQALSPANRQWIVPVAGGYQSLAVFGAVDASLPYMRLADPDSANRLIDISRLSMVAFPFRPPAAIVHAMRARVVITRDSLLFDSVSVVLPGTRASGRGGYALNGDGAYVVLGLAPLTFADGRFLYPDMPAGGGRLGLAFTSHAGLVHVVTSAMDLHSGTGVVAGGADFQLGAGSLRVGPSNVAFAGVDTRLVGHYAPAVPLKVDGTLAGELRLDGTPAAMQVGGWTDYRERGGPTSRLVLDGRVGAGAGGLEARGLRVRFQPLHLSLLRGYAPGVPYHGQVTGEATLTGSSRRGFVLAADLVDSDPAAGRSHLLANGRVSPRDGFSAQGLRLRFAPLQLALLRPFAPRLPFAGMLSGTTTLTGSRARGFDIVADVTHVDARYGQSRVTANGRVQVTGGFAARGLRLGFDPLQVAALKPFFPSLPFGGTLSGRTNLTASLATKQVAAILDLEHRGPTGYSHLVGSADATWRTPGFFDVNLRAPALSLATVGAFAPAAGLHGRARGTVVARGRLANLTTRVNLALPDSGGALDLRGTLDLAASPKRYDVTSTLSAFNAAAVSTHAPRTSLTGTVVARGAGTDPATLSAFLDARLVDSQAPGTPRLDSVLVTARLADGVATFERGHVRLSSALADVDGSFGLTPARSGTLHYLLRVDTISQFASHVPLKPGIVTPRPALRARTFARARADSLRIARATEVQRAAVGYPPPPPLRPDTVPLRRDTLAGSFSSEGTLTGNIGRFDARGTVSARALSLGASYVGRGSATFSLAGYGTPTPLVHLDAFGDTVIVAGFGFDSARVVGSYNGLSANGTGSADVAVFQDPQRDFRAHSDFDLSLDQKQVALKDVLLRFDTTTWRSSHPATIGWGSQGVTVGGLELLGSTGGYLRADGRLPASGSADLRLDVEGLQLGQIMTLAQDTASLQGVLGLHAHVQGTTRAPVLSGTVALVRGVWGGRPFPDLRATLSYADADLRGNAQFFQGPQLLATADAQLPLNLALSGVTGPRLLRTAPLQLDVRADSLPLEVLPSFTDAVSDVRGRVRGTVAVRGTLDSPTTNGALQLELGSLRVTSSGVLYNDIVGTVRLQDRTAHVDSIMAHAVGTIRATGTVDLAQLTRPAFDLAVAASDVTVLDNKWGRIRADASLAVKGPYTALDVSGDTRITGGIIYAPEVRTQHATNLDDPTLAGIIDTTGLGPNVLTAPNPLLQNLNVDVALRIDPDTWVRNSQANVEIYTPDDAGPLHVRMDNAHQTLSLLGSVNSDRGEYTYSGRVFQLSTGSATFLGGGTLNPLLQLSAIYNVQRRGQEALDIQINVSGTMMEPRVTFQSNAQPPLSQSDLLSYLAFGQSASSLVTLQSSAALSTGGSGGLAGIPALVQQQVGSLAIGAMVEQTVSDLQEQGTRAGLDVFRVHPGELPAEAAFQSYFSNVLNGTEIEAGKYLSRRFFVELRGRTTTIPGVLLEYRRPSGFTWTTTWEPRFLPAEPSFSALTASRVRAFGTFLRWSKRF